jgi:hypothetical protein
MITIMFKLSPASLQTFIDKPNCVLKYRVQYSTVHIPNVFCDGHIVCVFLYCNHQMRRRGRGRNKLLDDLKDRSGYSHLKEKALDRTVWRNRFGRDFGPVVRILSEWIMRYTETFSPPCTYKRKSKGSLACYLECVSVALVTRNAKRYTRQILVSKHLQCTSMPCSCPVSRGVAAFDRSHESFFR